MEEQIKKSYNPFKMWGSWIGAIVYTIGVFLISYDPAFPKPLLVKILAPLYYLPLIISEFIAEKFIGCHGMGCLVGIVPLFILLPIFGFLFGWGVHSLIRRFKN